MTVKCLTHPANQNRAHSGATVPDSHRIPCTAIHCQTNTRSDGQSSQKWFNASLRTDVAPFANQIFDDCGHNARSTVDITGQPSVQNQKLSVAIQFSGLGSYNSQSVSG
jgi:hypothetical protein